MIYDNAKKKVSLRYPPSSQYQRLLLASCSAIITDEEKVRKTVGSLESGIPLPDDHKIWKSIMFSLLSPVAIPFALCVGKGILEFRTSINDGPGCLKLRCPDPSCGAAAVGHDMVNELASKDDEKKYIRYFFRSVIEDNRMTKWCPAPGCDYAVDFTVGGGNFDVPCHCAHSFCWNQSTTPTQTHLGFPQSERQHVCLIASPVALAHLADS
ncbi:RBR-type E3 ubiquitin transferase [Salvia divinorum]|uniref:RBR-type E3 ubiquitin transferase n=1 Tax=Salvia divinorum TaxID=28513 RepID=A0ABD1H7H2_SALDI